MDLGCGRGFSAVAGFLVFLCHACRQNMICYMVRLCFWAKKLARYMPQPPVNAFVKGTVSSLMSSASPTCSSSSSPIIIVATAMKPLKLALMPRTGISPRTFKSQSHPMSTREKSLTLSPPIALRLYTLPHWSNPPFLIFDIWALWRSGLSARAPKCQKLKIVR